MHAAMVNVLTKKAITAVVNSNGNPYNVMVSCDPMISWLPHPIKAPPIKQLKTVFNFNGIGLYDLVKKPVDITAMKKIKNRIRFSVLLLKLFCEISLITFV